LDPEGRIERGKERKKKKKKRGASGVLLFPRGGEGRKGEEASPLVQKKKKIEKKGRGRKKRSID